MNNQRNQPIYDNKSLKQAGKYNFENVNSVNRRLGEMEFNATIETKEKKHDKRILITAIISVVLIVCVSIFSFTDLKYLFIKKHDEKPIEENFESDTVMHELSCSAKLSLEGINVSINKKYMYNNNKVKLKEDLYVIEILNNEILDDKTFSENVNNSINEIITTYEGTPGLEIMYTKENNGKKYTLIQNTDLRLIDKNLISTNIIDTYLDQDINVVKQRQIDSGLTCSNN